MGQIYFSPADADASAPLETNALTTYRPLANGAAHHGDRHTLLTLAEFDQWVDFGFAGELIPLLSGDKKLFERGWSKREWPIDEVRAKIAEGSNVGLRLAKWAVFDVEDTPLGDRFLEALRKHVLDAPMRSRAGSRSKALLVAVEGPVSEWQVLDELQDENGAVLDEKGRPVSRYLVELLAGSGAQLHILGHRADCNDARLEWSGMTAHVFLPVVSQEKLIEIRDEMAQIARDAGSVGVTTTAPLLARVGGRSTDQIYPARQWIESKVLIEALECIENDRAWCDLDTWMRMAFAVGRLSGGDEEVECEFYNWSLRPQHVKNEKTNNLFRDAREGRVVMHPGAAAGLLAGYLREHPARGRVKRAADLADVITRAVDAPLALEALTPLEDAAAAAGGAQAQKKPTRVDLWRAKLIELRTARDEPGHEAYFPLRRFTAPSFSSVIDDDSLPLIRPTITDRHERGTVTLFAADPGTGKSTLTSTLALAIALERPEMIGLKKIDWAGAVMIVSNEDGRVAVKRQMDALRKYHNIKREDFRHDIRVWDGDHLALAAINPATGVVEPTDEAFRLLDNLIGLRRSASLALLVVDTLASSMQGVGENDSGEMTSVMTIAREIAVAAFCGVEFTHHKKKKPATGGREGGAQDFRGSIAILGSVRASVDAEAASVKDAQDFGWSHSETSSTIRFTGQKANGKKKAARQYFRFENVPITALDPRGEGTLVSEDVGILVHLRVDDSKRGNNDLFKAMEVLIEKFDAKVQILAGVEGKGPKSENDARNIIAGALEIKPNRSTRSKKDEVFASDILGQLLAKKFIAKVKENRDGRGVECIHPTPAGRDFYAKAAAEEERFSA